MVPQLWFVNGMVLVVLITLWFTFLVQHGSRPQGLALPGLGMHIHLHDTHGVSSNRSESDPRPRPQQGSQGLPVPQLSSPLVPQLSNPPVPQPSRQALLPGEHRLPAVRDPATAPMVFTDQLRTERWSAAVRVSTDLMREPTDKPSGAWRGAADLTSACGWVRLKNGTDQQAYTQKLNKITKCFQRQLETEGQLPPSPHRFACPLEIDPERLREKRRVWFIGDSVLAQQFRVLVCTLNASFDPKAYTGPYALGAYPWAYNHSGTELLYTQSGIMFNNQERLSTALNTGAPSTIRSASSTSDVIVLNSGLHFQSEEKLVKTIRLIATRSVDTNASVLLMETTDEQWPTANGLYDKKCMWFCHCEVLNADRFMGKGEIDPRAKSNHTSCVPDCRRPDWRVTATLKELEGSIRSRVLLVPVWNQLMAHGEVHSRKVGDCTHKSPQALLMMNQQLLQAIFMGSSNLSVTVGDFP